MKHGKPIIESLFNNLVRIVLIIALFIIFGIITYRIPMSLNVLNRLSIFAVQFYASVLQAITLFFIFKYPFNKENETIKEDENKFKINLFDILIFLFMGLLIKSILHGSLFYLEYITDTGPKYDNDVISGLIKGMEITNLDRIYSLITGVILAPIVEELFYRKGVFKYFTNKGVKNRTMILISGISFGLIHLTGYAIPLSVMLAGIIYAIIYATTKNIIYPIIGHGINNLMPFIITIFRDNSGIEDVQAYIEAGYLIEIKGAIIISLVLLIITSLISYIKRKTIISSDFKNRLKEVFTE